jgi:hypothetical protein
MTNAMQAECIKHLAHALTFTREAKKTPHAELRQQHLDEVERLIVGVAGILMESNGKATS